MADFVNPAYATPAQIEARRRLAAQLMQPSDVKHWTQGVGDIVRALVGGHIGAEAGEQERAGAAAFGKKLLEATSSKDPAKAMELMSDPRAAPIQALLLGKLMEWGPAQGMTLPGGLAAHGPVAPWFDRGESVPAAAPVSQGAPLPPATPAPYQSAVGDIVPGSRTTEGASDAAIDAIGARYGIPNAAALNRAGMEQVTQMEERKAAATARGAQKQAAEAQEPISTPTRQRIPEEIKSVLKDLEGESFINPLTGKAGYVRSQMPGTPAANLNAKLETVKDLVTQLWADQEKAAHPMGRPMMPQQMEMYRQSLGLDLKDREVLKRSLHSLLQRYGQGTGYEPTPQPQPPQGAFPAQAGESTGGGYKVLKVTPYGGQ